MTASTAYNNVLSAAEVSSSSAEKQKISCLKTMIPSATDDGCAAYDERLPTVPSKEKLHELLQNEQNQDREPNQDARDVQAPIDKYSDADGDAVREIGTYSTEEWTLHKLLQNRPTVEPQEVQTVIDKYPDAVRKIDDDGWLPLHVAVMNRASAGVIRVLLKADPSAAKKTAKVYGGEDILPLHIAIKGRDLTYNVSLDVVKMLLDAYPEGAEKRIGGTLSLGWALDNTWISDDIVLALLAAYPDSAKTNLSNESDVVILPLHYAIQKEHSQKVVKALLDAYPGAAKEENPFKSTLQLFDLVEKNPNAEDVQAMIDKYPDAVRKKGMYGALPLHWAVGAKASAEVIRVLLKANPSAAKTMIKGHYGEVFLPLHLAIYIGCSLDVVKALLDGYPEGAEAKTSWGKLPLNLALRYSVSDEVTLLILNAYPQAAKQKDPLSENDLPLHDAICMNASEEVIRQLFNAYPQAAKKKMKDGRLPIEACSENKASEDLILALLKADMPLRIEDGTPLEHNGSWTACAAFKTDVAAGAVRRILSPVYEGGGGFGDHIHALADIRDAEDRTALGLASSGPRAVIYEYLLFSRRYKLRNGAPEHLTKTSVVLRAQDLDEQSDYGVIFDEADVDKNGKLDRQEISTLVVSKIGLDPELFLKGSDESISKEDFVGTCKRQLGDGPRDVVIKLMQKKDQWERECDARKKCNLDSKYVVSALPNIPSETDIAEAVSRGDGGLDTIVKKFLDGSEPGKFAIVMDAADRNLHQIFYQEQPKIDAVRVMLRQVFEAVRHLHEKKLMHGDLKMLNIVRFRIDNRLRLIDLDASAKIVPIGGDDESFAGAKFSSAILPPEMIERIETDEQLEKFIKYWEGEKDEVLSEKVAPKIYKKQGIVKARYVVKSFRTERGEPVYEGLPYDLVKAAENIDAWALGALAFTLLTGETLIPSTRDDDCASGAAMHLLYSWGAKPEVLSEVFKKIHDDAARDLVRQLLCHEPEERPTVASLLETHPFFHPERDDKEMTVYVREMKERLEDVDNTLRSQVKQLEIMNANIEMVKKMGDESKAELFFTRHVLLKAIFDATEVTTPTTFTILNNKLSTKQSAGVTDEKVKKILNLIDKIDAANDGSGISVRTKYASVKFSADGADINLEGDLKEYRDQVEVGMKWAKRIRSVVSNVAGGEVDMAFESIKEGMKDLIVEKEMYLYLIDELTGEPVQAPGWPITITEPSDNVPKLLPLMQVGMRAMSIYNGTAGVARMFGFPAPKVPKAWSKGTQESIELLKQESSVKDFGVVHAEVNKGNEEGKSVRGASLREFVDFMKKHVKVSRRINGCLSICDILGTSSDALIRTHGSKWVDTVFKNDALIEGCRAIIEPFNSLRFIRLVRSTVDTSDSDVPEREDVAMQNGRGDFRSMIEKVVSFLGELEDSDSDDSDGDDDDSTSQSSSTASSNPNARKLCRVTEVGDVSAAKSSKPLSSIDILPSSFTFPREESSIRAFLFDQDGKLCEDIIAVLNKEGYGIVSESRSQTRGAADSAQSSTNSNISMTTTTTTTVTPKSRRSDRVVDAVKAIAPRYNCGDTVQWDGTGEVSNGTTSDDANDLETLLAGITRDNPQRAAKAILRMLDRESCICIKDIVGKVLNAPASKQDYLANLVITGIKKAFAHHTNAKGGTRTIAAETFIKNTVLACTWYVAEDNISVPISVLSSLIGTTEHQIKIGLENARHLIDSNDVITALERARRKDFIRDVLVPHVLRWILDDEVTRFDSNQTIVEIDVDDPSEPGKKFKGHQRIWRHTNAQQQHQLFLDSRYYREFMDENPNATGVGITVFRDCLKKFRKLVSDPSPESCVDEKTSGLEYAMQSLYDVVRSKDAMAALEGHTCNDGETDVQVLRETLRLRSSHKMVDLVCCAKKKQHDLHIDKDKDCPEMIPLECTHGRKGDKRRRCKCCGVEKRLGRVLKLLSEDENVGSNVVTVMVWEKARRQGKGKNGKDNTQKELTSKPMTVAQLIAHFKGLLGICIPHIQEIRWIKHLQDTDFSKMSLDTILIFSDFAALMALRALQTKNSSVDAHAVLANFVVLSVKRVVTVVGKKKNELGEEEDVEEEVTISNVDVIHFFAETFEKGKKNDHCMHNTCLDEIIRKYRVKLKQKYGIDLKYVIIWTDNAPHQYRCRQTFIQIASIRLRHPGIQITHRLAVVDNFKGIHDAVGKDPSRTVRELETVGIRSPTAFMVFVNCIQHLEKFETKWDAMEKARDRRLILKGMFGYNSREMYFVVETKKDFDRLVDQYPGRILLCDRSIIQDTLQHKCIEGTMQLHEVRSIETGIPEPYEAVLVPEDGINEEVKGQVRPWPVVISNLPCNCKVCIGIPTLEAECEGRTLKVKVTQDTDVANQRCKYHLFRKTREYTMLGPVHLEPTSPSSEASVDVANELSELESRELVVASNSNLSNTEVTPQVPNGSSSDDSADVTTIETRLHIDATSIEALRMLRAKERAMVKGLLQSEPNSAYDLHYSLNAAAVVQHASLRTLREPHWLNDEVINGFRAHYLLPKLDEHSYIFPSQFMSHLLNTGPHGMDPPNYTYENVNRWSGRIRGGLFHCHKLYVPINHENVHWLLMRINMLEKKISLWDPEGEKETNMLYADAALNYLKDEYRNTHPSITRTNLRDWLSTWTIEDLSDDCPHQQNGYDCGIFLLLNLCLLIEEDHLSEDSYSQTSINTKEVRNTIAHLLWKASSNRPTPQPSAL